MPWRISPLDHEVSFFPGKNQNQLIDFTVIQAQKGFLHVSGKFG